MQMIVEIPGVLVKASESEGEDSLPGGSSRPRELDKGDLEEKSSKCFRWWDEFSYRSSGSTFDSYSEETESDSENSSVDDAAEDDALPGPS